MTEDAFKSLCTDVSFVRSTRSFCTTCNMSSSSSIVVQKENAPNGYTTLKVDFPDKSCTISYSIYATDRSEQDEIRSTMKNLDSVLTMLRGNTSGRVDFSFDRFFARMDFVSKDVFLNGGLKITVGNVLDHALSVVVNNHEDLIDDVQRLRDTFAELLN